MVSGVVVALFVVVAVLAPVIAKVYGKNPYTKRRPGLLNEYGTPEPSRPVLYSA